MTTDRQAPYCLQVGGVWRQLVGVAPGVTVTPSRPTSTFTTLGNTVYAQVARKVARTWGFAFEWEDAEAGRWLDYAATNPGAVWLLDRNVAQQQMLTVAQSLGTSATTLLVDGMALPTFVAATTATRKLRAGVAYSLSYTTNRTAGATVGSFNIGAGAVNFVAPSGSGARRGSVSFTPVADVDAVITWTTGNATTAARLTQGSVDSLGWLPSTGGTPSRVMVSDGVPTYNMAWTDRLALADSSYVLTEVG